MTTYTFTEGPDIKGAILKLLNTTGPLTTREIHDQLSDGSSNHIVKIRQHLARLRELKKVEAEVIENCNPKTFLWRLAK